MPWRKLRIGAERRKLRRLVGAFRVRPEAEKKLKIVVASASGLCNDALNQGGKDPQKGRAS